MKRVLLLTSIVGTAAVVASLLLAPAGAAGDAMYGAPKAGHCYAVSGKVAWTADATRARPISCHKPHTLWVAAVARIPAGVSMDPYDHELTPYIKKTCRPAEKRMLGSLGVAFARSAYTLFVFNPTKAQRAAGARWVSCEIGVFNGGAKLVRNKRFRPVRATSHLPQGLRLCLTRKSYTNCAARHAFRPVAVVRVNTRKGRVHRAHDRRVCTRKLHGRAGLASARWFSPKRYYLVCSVRSHR